MGCLGTIVMFPRLTLEAYREIRSEKKAEGEGRRKARALRAKYEPILKSTKTRNEGLEVLSQASTEVADDFSVFIADKQLPTEGKLFVMKEFERQSDEAFERFRKTGNYRDQLDGEMFLRFANEIRKQLQPQETTCESLTE
jgi:hypothetical protein